MTDENKAAYITALLDERRGCEKRGMTDRVKAIDEELRLQGHKAATPAKRAESRPRAIKKKIETR